MFDSLFNLPEVMSILLRGHRRSKKRRAMKSKSCFALVENLENRQLLSAANASADDDFVPRIVNGTTTTDFEAVGQLTFTPTTGAVIRSSGTLITDRWVLTSATASKNLTEAGGSATVVLGGETYIVDDIVTYPKTTSGSGDYKQDIALWHLTTAVPGSIVPVAFSRLAAKAKSDVTLVGFGGGGTGTTGSDGIYGTKRTADNTIDRVSPSLLVWKFRGSAEGTSADGDRGGPVLQLVGGTYQIVGVSSEHTTPNSKTNDLAFNTRVDIYAGWIDDVTGQSHPASSVVDDYIDTADTVGSTNALTTFTSTKKSFTINGKLGHYGDVDVVKFVTPSNGVMTIDLQNSTTTGLLDTTLEILDSTGVVLFTNDDVGASNLNSRISQTLVAGTYFVRISGYQNQAIGTYRLGMSVTYTGGSSTAPPAVTADLSAVGQVVFTPTTGAQVFSTGVLIADQWILTAASASNGLALGAHSATVIVGGATYIVDQIQVYDKFQSDGGGDFKQDLALWHLTTAVVSSIVPVNVAVTAPAVASTVTLAGFGGTSKSVGGVITFDTLKSVTNKIDRVSPSTLAWKLDNVLELSNSAGDTGGAVLKVTGSTVEVVGIASPVSNTTSSAIGQTVYSTRTDLYLGWIDDVLGRAHAVVTTADDYINAPDLVGTGNKTSTFTTTKTTFEVLGKFAAYDDVDVFKIITPSAGIIELRLASQNPGTQFLDTTLTLLAADGVTVVATHDDIGTSSLGSEIVTYLPAGTYFVQVGSYLGQQKGAYRLTMTSNIDNVSGVFASAKSLTPNSLGTITTEAIINEPGDVDYYKFTANASGRYQFDFEKTDSPTFDPVIEVFTAGGVSLAQNDDISTTGTINRNARVVVTGLVSGTTYFIKLSGYGTSSGIGKLTIRKTGV